MELTPIRLLLARGFLLSVNGCQLITLPRLPLLSPADSSPLNKLKVRWEKPIMQICGDLALGLTFHPPPLSQLAEMCGE